MFWLLAGGMVAALLALLLLPLLRRPHRALARAEYDLAVYRDQLRELEQEMAEGLIGGEAAERARNEIAHRILAADKARQQARAQVASGRRSTAVAAVLAAVLAPLAALAFYVKTGEPGRPDMPLQQRLANAARNHDLPALVRRAEQRLARNPGDLRGWLALAPAYQQLGRPDKAAEAWRRAIALAKTPSARLYDAYGEALVQLARGRIEGRAVQAFRKAQELKPGDPMSRYYLAMADLQAGRREKAYESLKKLLADLSPEVPARAAVARQVAQLAQALGKSAPALARASQSAPASPAAAAAGNVPMSDSVRQRMQAMRNATPEQRMAMIRGMVEGLAQRLKDNPKDLNGWLRLIRARKVLGEDDKARAALNRANAVFAGNGDARQRLAALAAQLGIAP